MTENTPLLRKALIIYFIVFTFLLTILILFGCFPMHIQMFVLIPMIFLVLIPLFLYTLFGLFITLLIDKYSSKLKQQFYITLVILLISISLYSISQLITMPTRTINNVLKSIPFFNDLCNFINGETHPGSSPRVSTLPPRCTLPNVWRSSPNICR